MALAYGTSRRRIMWLPVWRLKMNPARSNAARTSRPERSVGSLATCQSLGLWSLDFNQLFAGFGGNRIARVPAILHVKLDRFTNIFQRFSAIIALADASRQRRYAGDVATIFFLLQYDRIAHVGSPMDGL